jgi:oligopeptidase B
MIIMKNDCSHAWISKELFEEMKARIKENDESVPYLYNGYYYITRFETGKDYPIYSRKKKAFQQKKRSCWIAMN